MAFLCPSRLGYSNRGKRERGQAPTPRGRITGSDSIDTIEQIGLEKQNCQHTKDRVDIVQDFDPKAPGEVQVTKGESCRLICTTQDWFYIEKSNGRKGYVPNSVCCTLTDVDTVLSRTNSVCSSRLSEYSADLSDTVTEVDSMISRNMSPLFKPKAKENSNSEIEMEVRPFYKTSHGQYIVLFDFLGLNENDVSVERAELVEVLNIEDPDWSWVRKYDGQEGFVPKTYICPVEPLRKLVRNGGFQRKAESKNKPKFNSIPAYDIASRSTWQTDDDISMSQCSTTSDCHDMSSISLTSVSDCFSLPGQTKHNSRIQSNIRQPLKTDNYLQETTTTIANGHDFRNMFQSDFAVHANCTRPNSQNSGQFLPSEQSFDKFGIDKNQIPSACTANSQDITNTSQPNRQPNIYNSFSPNRLQDNSTVNHLIDPEPCYQITNKEAEILTNVEKIGEKSDTDITKVISPNCEKRKFQSTDVLSDKYRPFQNVTEELAAMLKKRQQILERSVSDASRDTYRSKSTLGSGRSSNRKPSKGIQNENTSNFVEYVMKYEYKGQSHGQQNIYVQKGEAIYADQNAQNSTEWIWVHIPRTNQYGYIPVTYAEKQSTVVL